MTSWELEEGRRAWGIDCGFEPNGMFRKDLAEMLLFEQRCGGGAGANPADIWSKGIPEGGDVCAKALGQDQ